MTTPIPIDVLATASNCIRQAIAADPSSATLPPVSDALINQTVEALRAANPVPPNGISLVDKAASLLRTIIKDLYEPFRADLPNGRISGPSVSKAGLRPTVVAALRAPSPDALFLIEEYRVTSFLGRYGTGRTLNAMTLLPGEETTIRLKTWRSTSTTDTATQSVVDSEDQAVSSSFATKLNQEATDTSSRQASSSWHVEGEASAKWVWGSASISAGSSGETHTSRENFARTATEEVKQNAREARSQRKTDLSESTTTTTTAGEENAIERVVKNVNLRRTLNFVFRELNQEYITRLHMTGIRLAYSIPGVPGTWTEYALAELPILLERHIVSASRQQVASDILGTVATVQNHALMPVYPLQLLTVAPAGTVAIKDLLPGQNGLNLNEMPLKGTGRWVRWKPGPLAPAPSKAGKPLGGYAVAGVLLSEQTIVMPTGAIVVEAALGDRDALDAYAMRAQEAQLAGSEASSARELLLNEALGQLDGEERVRAYAEATFGADESQNGAHDPSRTPLTATAASS